MVFDPYARTVSRLGRLLSTDGTDALPDGELLRRYAAVRDEAAFAALVRRHGPLVFGVCRRTLAHQQDAEDAFQATFLVLARRANGVRGGTLGRWLYGVARRVANKARVRRAKHNPSSVDLGLIPGASDCPPLDWLPLLDAALAKLSDRDRWPILLCDLQGRTRADAAAALGIGEGTLSSRLARAREKLRQKLGGLGVTLSAATLATGLTESASGTVPPALMESTLAAGSSAAAARDLAEGVLRTMALWTLAHRSALAVGLLAAGIVLVPWAGAEQTPAAKEVPKPEVKADTRPDRDRLQGAWVVEEIKTNGDQTVALGFGYVHEVLTFSDDGVTFSKFPGDEKRFRLSPDARPKRIDFELRDVPDGLKKVNAQLPCLYEFIGDKLHLVLGNLEREERPASLEHTEKGPPFLHLTLHRLAVTDEERKRLRGDWVGRRASESGLPNVQLVVGDTELRLNAGGFQIVAEYTLEATATPRRIELIASTGGPLEPRDRFQGIYELDGDRLALAIALKGRPVNFRPSETNPHTFVFSRRVPPGRAMGGPGVGTPTEKSTGQVASAGRIRKLLEERATALRQQLEGQFERVKIGKDPLIQLLEASRELWEVEMMLAGDYNARLKVCEEYHRSMVVVEQQVLQLQEAGLQTRQGVGQSKAARLKAEIELEKVKAEK